VACEKYSNHVISNGTVSDETDTLLYDLFEFSFVNGRMMVTTSIKSEHCGVGDVFMSRYGTVQYMKEVGSNEIFV
jgi:hypothetical protein